MMKITIGGTELQIPHGHWNSYDDATMVRTKCCKCGGELVPVVIDFSVPCDMEDLSVKGLFCLECRNLSVGNEQKKRLEEIGKTKGFSL